MPIQRPNISGNAGTASKLQTQRTIGGVAFDGSANINLPGVNQTGSQDTSGNAASATKLANDSGTAPSYSCRAWVNFNGTGTVAIRASGNVSSITDNGTGDYTVNFTTAMSDANYCGLIATEERGLTPTIGQGNTTTGIAAASCRVNTFVYDNTPYDAESVNVAFFR